MIGVWGFMNMQQPKTKADLSVLIVTFKERAEYVKDLVSRVRKTAGNDVDILIAVNGNNEELTDENYRQDMLQLCINTPKCYPIICPEFKSLPKLWNTLVLFSRTEYNFILCDDVGYDNKSTIDAILNYINTTGEEFFTINGGFSHFVLTKSMLHQLNYFDERLCGFGEEDGDIMHSYILTQRRSLPILRLSGIYNKALYNIKNADIETHIDNKPKFNREFFFVKYAPDPKGICGMNPTPLARVLPTKQQYPYEMFVKHNKHNIKKYTGVILKYD